MDQNNELETLRRENDMLREIAMLKAENRRLKVNAKARERRKS